MKNGLKSRDFERRGVHRSGWWASFFWVFDAADNMAIGAKVYYHAKVGSFRDSIRVLRDSKGSFRVCLEFRLFVEKCC